MKKLVNKRIWLADDFFSGMMAGAKEVSEQDDMFLLVAPQNAVGNCIIDVRSSSVDVPFQNLKVLHVLVAGSAFNLVVDYAGSKSYD